MPRFAGRWPPHCKPTVRGLNPAQNFSGHWLRWRWYSASPSTFSSPSAPHDLLGDILQLLPTSETQTLQAQPIWELEISKKHYWPPSSPEIFCHPHCSPLSPGHANTNPAVGKVLAQKLSHSSTLQPLQGLGSQLKQKLVKTFFWQWKRGEHLSRC